MCRRRICSLVLNSTGIACTCITARLRATPELSGTGLTSKTVRVNLCLAGAGELISVGSGSNRPATSVVRACSKANIGRSLIIGNIPTAAYIVGVAVPLRARGGVACYSEGCTGSYIVAANIGTAHIATTNMGATCMTATNIGSACGVPDSISGIAAKAPGGTVVDRSTDSSSRSTACSSSGCFAAADSSTAAFSGECHNCPGRHCHCHQATPRTKRIAGGSWVQTDLGDKIVCLPCGFRNTHHQQAPGKHH